MATRDKAIRSLVAIAGLLAAVLLKSCSGGSSSLTTTPLSAGGDRPTAGIPVAIVGRVLDPFVLLGCPGNSEVALCRSRSVIFGPGSLVQLFNLSSRGDLLLPARDTTSLEAGGRFGFSFQGEITNPTGQLVQVTAGDGSILRGFVFSAAVDVSPWSEALYRILLRERNQGRIVWTNLTAAELRDLENILFTQVPLSGTARTFEELVSDLIDRADRLSFGNLRFVGDLIRVCYAPEGNQSDERCRVEIPIPLPSPIPDLPVAPLPTPAVPTPAPSPTTADPTPTPEQPRLVLINRAFVTVNGVTQSSNAVSITITFP